MTLSRRQMQVFRFVRDFGTKEKRAPTLQEICQGVGLNQPIEASRYLSILEEKKYLSRVPGMRGSIRIIKHPDNTEVMREQAAYARGVAAGKAAAFASPEASDALALQLAYKRGLHDGRKELPKDIAEAFERGIIFGRKELQDELTYAEKYANVEAGSSTLDTPTLPFLRRSD